MEDDNYAPPKANIEIDESHRGSPIKAILAGTAIDLFGSLLLGIVLSIGYGIYLASRGFTADEIQTVLATVEPFTPLWYMGTILGSGLSMFAGYICAKIANYSEYRFAAILGLISGGFAILLSGQYYSPLELAAIVALTFACVFFGTWLHARGKQRPIG